MQGKKTRSTKLFYQVSLDDLVPADHLYRIIDRELDLRFLYAYTRRYYGKDGQQSIDPVVFFKMCLLGYLNNITSDRALQRFCSDSLACRWFLGYDLDEPLPVHSTLSRTRALLGQAVYLEVFRRVLDLCVQRGMVAGKRQAVDSALVKANASVDSMRRKVIMEDASAYCRQVARENADQPEPASPPAGGPDKEPPAGLSEVSLPAVDTPIVRKRSNKTHRSASDPDARLARKPNKPTDMYFHAQISVDGRQGVIVAALANFADLNDHESLPALLVQSRHNLAKHSLPLAELLADSGYNTYPTLRACRAAGVTPYMNNPSGYQPEREGFTYDAQRDSYWCSQEVELKFQGLKKNHGKYTNRTYASQPADCASCPLRAECLVGKKNYKVLSHSSGKAEYDRMYERLQTGYGQRMLARRKGIVEPVFGTLIHHYGMRKCFARGLEAAGKHVMMASAAFNLTKWLKQAGRPPRKAVQAAAEAVYRFFESYLHLQATF